MYEIASLESKKLAELQEIARKLNVKNTAGQKKQELIYQIIDTVAATTANSEQAKSDKNAEQLIEKSSSDIDLSINENNNSEQKIDLNKDPKESIIQKNDSKQNIKFNNQKKQQSFNNRIWTLWNNIW